jgi:hypothetical protein
MESRNPLVSWLMVAVGALIAAALLIQAFAGAPTAFKAAGPIGSVQAVTLANGQIYFGTLKSEDAGGIVLTDVFDVANNVNQDTNQHATQLIRRATGSVYGPTDLAVPMDKIVSTETVGKESTVAKGIASMQAAQTAK